MIIQEDYDEGRVRTFSDQNLKIRQIETGNIYEEAVDYVPVRFTYEETDEEIEIREEE